MTDPLVSIVVPAYQAGRVVGGALASALTQTYPSVEVVVTDDGSTDETASVLAGYGSLVRVVSQPNSGVSRARHAAIEAARGELVCLLDADDLLMPSHVELAVRAYRSAGTDRCFVTSEALLMSAGGILESRRVLPGGTPAPDKQRMRILENNFVSIFALLPRTMWEELGGFDEQMGFCEDYDFWARGIFAGWTAVFQPHPSALYRKTTGSLSSHDARMYAGDRAVLEHLRDHYADVMTAPERELLERRLAGPSPHRAIHEGEAALRSGDVRAAARHFRAASSLMPSDLRIRRKALLLERLPAVAQLYSRRLVRKDAETGRTATRLP